MRTDAERIKEKFAGKLNQLMSDKDMTISDIERGTGISKQLLSLYAKGRCMPSLVTVKKLSEFFGVSEEVWA